MADGLEPDLATIERTESDCMIASENDSTDLTENELLDLLNDELDHSLGDRERQEQDFQPIRNGLDDTESGQQGSDEPIINGAIGELAEEDLGGESPKESSPVCGEDESVEADIDLHDQNVGRENGEVSEAPESCQELEGVRHEEGVENQDVSNELSVDDKPEADCDVVSVEDCAEPLPVVQRDADCNSVLQDLNEIPEDELDLNRGSDDLSEDSAGDANGNDEPESESGSSNPMQQAAAQQDCDIAESPSTESANNAPEDEQSPEPFQFQSGPTVAVNDVTVNDDVIGEDCPEEDQFVNEESLNEEGVDVLPVPSTSHRGSSDDELPCVEADLVSTQTEQLAPVEVASPKPSSSSPAKDQCYEPECDQSDTNGNPEMAGAACATSNGSLESIPLSSSTKEDEFGDFVQSEPSSPQINGKKNSPPTLLSLADDSRVDASKLNPDDLVQLSRRSSNQSLDSYDVIARSLESEEDDDVTVTSYRELLKRYTQLREQKEQEGPPPDVGKLRAELDEQREEVARLNERLEHHDLTAKRAVAQLQTEMKTRVDQVTKMYDDVLAEKDSMVVKFAQQELKNTEYIRKQEAMEAKFREMAKDREILLSKLKGASIDKSKLSAQLHAKHGEVINCQKEIHKLKDVLSSQDVKVKWAHNKLKNEMESHKDSKASLEKTMNKLKEAREETETIRKNCQQMIKTYQESEDIKSNSLDQKLKEKMAQMKQEQQERRDQDEVHQMVVNELESLKRKHKEALEEIQSTKDRLICLDQERDTQEKCITSYRDSLQLTKRENEEMASRLHELENIAEERDRANKECEEMRVESDRIKQQDKEYSLEAENCRARETQLLELTEKLTNKNALLQSENTSLSTRNSAILSELEHMKNNVNELGKSCRQLKEELHDEKVKAKTEIENLTKSLNEKTKLSDELKRSVDDKTDEIKVIKRRQAATIKDLTRQLQQAKRRIEAQEPVQEKADSLGSRTSSSNSLDMASPPNHDHGDVQYSGSDPPTPMEALPSMAETPVVRHVEPDKQMLIERIVKLQRINARKSEKIEFLEDHINQLLLEIKKKNRLIQHYVTREESGALASNSSDNVKSPPQAQISRKGGIMASIYGSHSTDQSMTLELSLQINGKLQAVLEDTLLKNITLKENIDTLGAEIARLSQENRNLQLKDVNKT